MWTYRLTDKDEWYAVNSEGKEFSIFGNGTSMAGTLILRPDKMKGQGEVNTADARITSETFSFGLMSFEADTSDYYLRALKGNGYGFVAKGCQYSYRFHHPESIIPA